MNDNTNPGNDVRRCPRCGKEMTGNASFCNACGLNLNGEPYVVPMQPIVQEDTRPLRTSDYFVMLLVAGIPVVGLILMLVWAFSSTTNVNRRNFCRAQLIMKVIGWVLSILLIAFYAAIFSAIAGELTSNSDLFYSYGQILPLIFH